MKAIKTASTPILNKIKLTETESSIREILLQVARVQSSAETTVHHRPDESWTWGRPMVVYSPCRKDSPALDWTLAETARLP
jgi:hypothetical protein